MNMARRALAAAAVSALALAGCAQSPTHAAVVDGHVITDAQVTDAAEAAAPLTGATATALEASVVQAVIQGYAAEKVAVDKKVELSDATRAPIIAASPVLSALSTKAGGQLLATKLANLQVVSATVQQDDFAATCAQMQVVVNPRFGSWGKELCGFDSASGSLSKAAPTATASQG